MEHICAGEGLVMIGMTEKAGGVVNQTDTTTTGPITKQIDLIRKMILEGKANLVNQRKRPENSF